MLPTHTCDYLIRSQVLRLPPAGKFFCIHRMPSSCSGLYVAFLKKESSRSHFLHKDSQFDNQKALYLDFLIMSPTCRQCFGWLRILLSALCSHTSSNAVSLHHDSLGVTIMRLLERKRKKKKKASETGARE